MAHLGSNSVPLTEVVASSGEKRNNYAEANFSVPQKAELEKMARRRFQNPKPQRRGPWWTLLVYRDVYQDGERKRQRQRSPTGSGNDAGALKHRRLLPSISDPSIRGWRP